MNTVKNIQEARQPDVLELADETVEEVPVNIGHNSTGGERERAPVEYLCCSVSSGCVSNVWHLFTHTLAL